MLSRYIVKFNASVLSLFFVLPGNFASAVTLTDSEYERVTYTVEANAASQSCITKVFEIVEPLPKGFHSILSHSEFNGGKNIKIVVVKKKSVSENFTFNILCVSKWQDGTTLYTPVAKINIP